MIFTFLFVRVYVGILTGGVYMSVNKSDSGGTGWDETRDAVYGRRRLVANFSSGNGRDLQDKNGERQKRTEWPQDVVWGKQAEIAQQYSEEGSLIFIEGRIPAREWQDRKARSGRVFEIVASNFRMLADAGTAAVPVVAAERRAAAGRRKRSISRSREEAAPTQRSGIRTTDIPFSQFLVIDRPKSGGMRRPVRVGRYC